MIDSWLKGIQNGEPCIDYNSLMQTSLATILSIESLSIGMPLDVDSKLYKIKSS
jgi:polar amino acid transport system substrate-binding protein